MRFPGFFDEEFKLERISTLGDPLERLNQVVNWEIFSEILLHAMQSKERKGADRADAMAEVPMYGSTRGGRAVGCGGGHRGNEAWYQRANQHQCSMEGHQSLDEFAGVQSCLCLRQ